MKDRTITSVLMRDKENALTREQVAVLLNLSDTRTVSKMLESERQHAVIVGDGHGLYLPAEGEEGKHEVEHYIKLQSAKARGVFRSLKSARLFLKQLDGQVELSEV